MAVRNLEESAKESLLDILGDDEEVLGTIRERFPLIEESKQDGWVTFQFTTISAFEKTVQNGTFEALEVLGDKTKFLLPGGRTYYYPNGISLYEARRILREMKCPTSTESLSSSSRNNTTFWTI